MVTLRRLLTLLANEGFTCQHCGQHALPELEIVETGEAAHTTDPEAAQEKPPLTPAELEELRKGEALAVTREIVDLWNKEGGGIVIRVTPKRIEKVKVRLEEGVTRAELRQAILNIKQSPFHMGDNDRGWMAPGPEWVFHNAERTEEWVNKKAPPKPVKKDSYLESMENVKRMFLGGDGKERKA